MARSSVFGTYIASSFQSSSTASSFQSCAIVPSVESSSSFEPTGTEIGDVQNSTNEVTEIKWRIPNFLPLCSRGYGFCYSPNFFFKNRLFNFRFLKTCIFVSYPKAGYYIEIWSKEAERECPIEYHLGLKKNDGTVEQLIKGTLDKNKQNTDKLELSLSDIEKRKSELLSSNALTITCLLKSEVDPKCHPNQLFVMDKTKPLIRLDNLSQNFKDVFDDKETCDVILKVKDKEYKAHKLVLIARSKVFAANFKHDTLEKQTGIITIEDCDPNSFQDFLKYLYSGKLEDISYRSALSLYYTSDKYDIEELKTFCVEYLMQCLTIENLCEIAVFADKYEEKELFSRTQTFFNENASKIFETSEWLDLMRQDNRLANKLLTEMSKVKLKV